MERLHIVREDQAVLDARAAWGNRQHKERWKEFASESAYQNHRRAVRRDLFKAEWMPVAGLELSPKLIAATPAGLLEDLYPNVLQNGPMAEEWATWNRQLVQTFNGMNAGSGNQRANFVNDFINLYLGRILVIDPALETTVYERYREVADESPAFAKIREEAAPFFTRTMMNMNPNTVERLTRAYRNASELVLLSDLLLSSEKHKWWEKSLRLHRGFMRKAQLQIRNL